MRVFKLIQLSDFANSVNFVARFGLLYNINCRHILSRLYTVVLCQILRSAHAPRGPAGVNMVAARLCCHILSRVYTILLSDTAHAPRGPAGRNMAAARLCRLHT